MDKGKETMSKEYLGNNVYADFDGNLIVLTTEKGPNITSTINLDSEVSSALIKFIKKHHKQKKEVLEPPAGMEDRWKSD